VSTSAHEARRRFDRPALAPLWHEARRRFEQSDGPVTRLSLRALTADQQRAVADLLGLPYQPGPEVSIPVAKLDAVLRASPAGLDTRGVVEAVAGPLADRAGERRRQRAEREQLWSWLGSHPVVAAEPELRGWVDAVRGGGLVGGSVRRTRQVLESALAVVSAVPADGRSLPAFAADVCGDPHALDDGTRLSGYVMRALARLHGVPFPVDAEARRELWARSGVACDALSTTVLVAGLRPGTDDPLASTLRSWADAGQAAVVTLAHLHAHPVAGTGDSRVRVVENPSVMAEALGRFGAGCPPLVCTSGWPNTAAITLLRQLRDTGAQLHYHGDFDGEGIRIAAYVLAKTGGQPWRMTAADYLAAVEVDGPPVGRVSEAPWDGDLAVAMRDRAVAVPEEKVLDLLMADLAQQARSAARR
jgi:uncharacterized protein (TIGR02679 family)